MNEWYFLAVAARIFHFFWPLFGLLVCAFIPYVKNSSFSLGLVFYVCIAVTIPIILISQWLYSGECPLTEMENILWYLADTSSELVLKSEIALRFVAAYGLKYAPVFILGTVTLVFLAVTVPVFGIAFVAFNKCR